MCPADLTGAASYMFRLLRNRTASGMQLVGSVRLLWSPCQRRRLSDNVAFVKLGNSRGRPFLWRWGRSLTSLSFVQCACDAVGKPTRGGLHVGFEFPGPFPIEDRTIWSGWSWPGPPSLRGILKAVRVQIWGTGGIGREEFWQEMDANTPKPVLQSLTWSPGLDTTRQGERGLSFVSSLAV